MTEKLTKRTQWYLNNLLCSAAAEGDLKTMDQALERGAQVNGIGTIDRNLSIYKTPIHYAAENGKLEAVEKLIALKAVVNGIEQESYHDTPLIEAQDPKIVKALIEAGADVNQQRNRGDTALMNAVSNCNLEKVQLLLDAKADVHLKTDLEWTAFTHLSFVSKKSEDVDKIIKLLLDHGADKEVKGHDGQTTLFDAIEQQNTFIIPKLVAIGCNINAKDNSGATAIWSIGIDDNHMLFKTLIEHGADIYAKGPSYKQDKEAPISFFDARVKKEEKHLRDDQNKVEKLLKQADKDPVYQEKRKQVLKLHSPSAVVSDMNITEASKELKQL